MSDFNPSQRNAEDFMRPTWVAESLVARVVYALVGNNWIKGVDLSHWNEVDFVALKNSGVDFVILKATEGDKGVDDKFAQYWLAALDAGLLVMTYHFFRSNVGGIAQAKHHLDTIKDFLLVSGYKTPFIWFDLETEDSASISTRRSRLLEALNYVIAQGYQAGVYSSPYLWDKLIGNVSWIANFFGWVAHWIDALKPLIPIGWSEQKTIVWQIGIYPTHSWAFAVEGVNGNVDVDYYFGTREQLEESLGVPEMDCCEELRQEITRLEAKIDANKKEIDLNTKGRNRHRDRLIVIETFIQKLKDAVCIEE